jgi:hypothetical protein
MACASDVIAQLSYGCAAAIRGGVGDVVHDQW